MVDWLTLGNYKTLRHNLVIVYTQVHQKHSSNISLRRVPTGALKPSLYGLRII